MREIIRVECRRILNTFTFFVFFMILFLFSINSSYQAVKQYEVPNKAGIAITGRENLQYIKNKVKDKKVEDYLPMLKESTESDLVHMDEINAEALAALNYEGKSIQDLSEEEAADFYRIRLSVIKETLESDDRTKYTEQEKAEIMKRAAQLSAIYMDYAEGWKVMNHEMGIFLVVLLLLISIILLPLFGRDGQSRMEELSRATRWGKKRLDYARFLTAYGGGSILYLAGAALYFVIMMLPFGLEGGSRCIQSNSDTFFSSYNITYLQQFFLNVFIGLIALLFTISLTLFVSVLTQKMIASASVLCFFWITLLIAEQMAEYQVNHWFANFMPLGMINYLHYYVGNELYRAFGESFDSIFWCPFISFLLAVFLMIFGLLYLKIKRDGISVSASVLSVRRQAVERRY